jgi:hypothetical protein
LPPEIEEAVEAEIEQVETATDDVDASNEAEQSTTEESSPSNDGKKPEGESTLSVVRDVVGKSKEKPAEASSAEGVDAGEKPGAKTPKEPDNENYSDVPFNKHPRFKHLLGDLKEARTDAQRYKNVETFIDNLGLSADEAASTLKIGGLIKTDPVAAWKELLPIVQKVAIAAGEMLPDDLKQQVAEGKMPREAAIEISRSRAALATTNARTEWQQQRSQEQQAVQARQANLDAVSTWESERRARDPNFDAKMPALQKEVAWLQAKEGRPNNPAGIRAQLQKAYEAVVPTTQAPAQRPQAKRPVTGGQVAGNVQPEINSTLDVVRAVRARRAAA